MIPSLASLCKGLRKEKKRKERAKRTQQIVEGDQTWPPGGLGELITILKRSSDHISSPSHILVMKQRSTSSVRTVAKGLLYRVPIKFTWITSLPICMWQTPKPG